MKDLPVGIVGMKGVEKSFTYSWRDTALYALGVGATEPKFLYGPDMQVIPSFAVIPSFGTFNINPSTVIPSALYLNAGIEFAGGTHMGQSVEFYRPLPVSGKYYFTEEIEDALNRPNGKGLVFKYTVRAFDEQGYPIFKSTGDVLNPNYTVPGGKEYPKSEVVFPEAEPDFVQADKMSSTQNILYSLSGDINRIHVDDEAAKSWGLPKAIMQGLCAAGYACRMNTAHYLDCDASRVTKFAASFKAPLLPGAEIELRSWKAGESKVYFKLIDLGTGKAAVDNGIFEWK